MDTDIREPMTVKGFTMMNPDKIRHALYGDENESASAFKGIADADGSYDEDLLLATCDKFGGLIKKGSDKVKTGSFWDIKGKKAHATPKVVFEYNINGDIIEVAADEEAPKIVQAAKLAEEVKAEKKSKKKKRPVAEDADE
jgi:hypothetical protein